MKTILAVLLLSTSSLMAQQGQPVNDAKGTVQSHYTRGMIAIRNGDVTTAENAFKAVLALEPQNPHARFQLSQLMMNRGKIAATKRQMTMKQTTLAAVDYADATVSECLDTLTIQVKKATNDQFVPNFIIKDPQGKLSNKSVTLKLANVPAAQVLEYIASSAECKVTYEEHAIIVTAN
jgi:thioredoxin-like negative regulator of GroEL